MDIIYLLVYFFLKIIFTILPKFILTPLLNGIGTLAYFFDKKHRKIAFTNLDLCFGDTKTQIQKEQIVKQMYKNLAFFGYDFIQNQGTSKEKILQKVTIKNEEILQNALKSERPLVFQGAHYGTWELIPLTMSTKAGAISVIGRPLDSKIMNKILSKNRTQFDIEMIDKKNALKKVLKAIKNKRFLGIIVDQNTAATDGIEVKFFGKRVLHTPVLSIVAKKTNALIIPIFIKKTSNYTHELTLYEPIDATNLTIEEATQAQADITEKIICQKPDEYLWLHKRFKHFYESEYEK